MAFDGDISHVWRELGGLRADVDGLKADQAEIKANGKAIIGKVDTVIMTMARQEGADNRTKAIAKVIVPIFAAAAGGLGGLLTTFIHNALAKG